VLQGRAAACCVPSAGERPPPSAAAPPPPCVVPRSSRQSSLWHVLTSPSCQAPPDSFSQRHIASHLSAAAVATEDLDYPSCLLAEQGGGGVHAHTGTASAAGGGGGDASSAPPAAAAGTSSRSSSHVFPVLAASLAFLRRIEVALETSVFERLVGEVVTCDAGHPTVYDD